jgi:hypothetical protein
LSPLLLVRVSDGVGQLGKSNPFGLFEEVKIFSQEPLLLQNLMLLKYSEFEIENYPKKE